MKNHASLFLCLFLTDLQNLGFGDFAKVRKNFKKINWHDFSCIHTPLFDFLENFFDPKFVQVWPNFLVPFFFLSRQNGICQDALIPQV